MLASLLLLLSLQAPPVPDRMFLAPMRGDVDDVTRRSFESALLVAAKKRGVTAIGGDDLQAILDVEAAKQATGCSSDSCAAELADALGAPQLLTVTLAHVGDTWLLTLTRLERSTMHVNGRAQRTTKGSSPAGLFDEVDGLVGEVLHDAAAPSELPLLPIGAIAAGLGAATTAVGAGMWIVATGQHAEGKKLVATEPDKAADIRATYEPVYYAGIVTTVVGSVVLIGGAALFSSALVGEDEQK